LAPISPLLKILASESVGMRYSRLMVNRSTTLSLRAGSNDRPVTEPILTPFIMIGEAFCTPLIWS